MDKQLKNPLARTAWPPIRILSPRIKKRYLVDFRPHGRRYFERVGEARAFADAVAAEEKKKGLEALNFPTELRMAALQAQKRLHAWGKTLNQAVDHYVDWLESERRRHRSLLAQDCVEAYIIARTTDFVNGQLAKRSLREITMRARQLSAAFNGAHIQEINATRMKAFIESLPLSARSKVNVKVHAGTFFNWCVEQGHVDANPVKLRIKVPESEIAILSLDAVKKLLKAAQASGHDDIIAYTTISLFAGVRVNELHQLRWEHVDLGTRTIEVGAQASKVRKQRFVEINDTLLAWISPIRRGKKGKLIGKNWRRRWQAVSKAASISLGQNVLRHTAASMMIAISHRGLVSEQLGNSPQVLGAFYRRPVPKVVAQEFWSLRP